MAFTDKKRPNPAGSPAINSNGDGVADATRPILTPDEEQQVSEISVLCDKTMEQISRSKSYYGSEYLKTRVLSKIEDFDKKQYNFDKLFNVVLKTLNVVEIDNGSGGSIIAHKDTIQRENELVSLSLYEDEKFILPDHVVQAAIASKTGISEEQTNAVLSVCSSKRRVCVVEGTAGAGKSFTMEAIKQAYLEQGFYVTGIALSWDASQILGKSADLPGCSAIEGFVRRIDKARSQGVEYFDRPMVIIVDEAGLVGVNHMHKIITETHRAKYPVKIVLTGDTLQLNPVDAGNSLEAIVEHCGSARIDTIRRQKQISQRKAVEYLKDGLSGFAFYIYLQQECCHFEDDKEAVFDKVVRDYVSYMHYYRNDPKKSSLVLALSNKDVIELNNRIRQAFQAIGMVDDVNYEIKANDGKSNLFISIARGDRIVFKKNDVQMPIYKDNSDGDKAEVRKGLFNKSKGIIEEITPLDTSYKLKVSLSDGEYVEFDTKDYQNADGACPFYYNFATTIYSSQGQTVSKCFFIDSPLINRRLAYVGASRHTESMDIYFDKSELEQRAKKILGTSNEEEVDESSKPQKPKFLKDSNIQTVSDQSVAGDTDTNKNKNKDPNIVMIHDESEVAELLGNNSDVPKKINENNLRLLTIASYTWAKEDKNQTAIVYLKKKKDAVQLNRYQQKKQQEDNAKIQRNKDLTIDDMFDFKSSDYTVIPKIDIKKTVDIVNTKKLEIKKQNLAASSEKQETAKINKKQKQPSKDKNKGSFLSSLMNMFADDDVSASEIHHIEAAAPQKLDTTELIQYILPKKQAIRSVGVDGVIALESGLGGEKVPTPGFLKSLYGVFLDINKYNEVRVVARNPEGHITNRISLDGECLMHTGVPFIIINKADTQGKNPMYIINGLLDYLYALEYYNNKYTTTPEKMPHLIWNYKDTDYTHIVKILDRFSRNNRLFFLNRKESVEDWSAYEALSGSNGLENIKIQAKNPKPEILSSAKPQPQMDTVDKEPTASTRTFSGTMIKP